LGNSSSRLWGIFNKWKKNDSKNHTHPSLNKEKFKKLERLIETSIKHRTYYVQALVHRSFLEENEDYMFSNERLEFLGDSILNLVIGEYLFNKFPEEAEGFLTKVRAKMVNRDALNIAAERIQLSEFLLISTNVSQKVISNSKSILSDAFEALIGAIYLDSGLQACRIFIIRFVADPILEEGEHLIDENYKSQLLEYTQANKLSTPVYETVEEEGPHHAKVFTVEASIGNVKYGMGKGMSKKTAEQNAAKLALKKLIDHQRN
jgi:ribonuclease-3